MKAIYYLNYWLVSTLASIYRYQQRALAAQDWPRSQMLDDRIALLDGEVIEIDLRLRGY